MHIYIYIYIFNFHLQNVIGPLDLLDYPPYFACKISECIFLDGTFLRSRLMLHGHHVVWTDRDGNIGLRRDVSEQLTTAVISTVHVRHSMGVVHVVHDVEVTHLIIGGASVRKETRTHEQTASSKRQITAPKMQVNCKKPTEQHLPQITQHRPPTLYILQNGKIFLKTASSCWVSIVLVVYSVNEN